MVLDECQFHKKYLLCYICEVCEELICLVCASRGQNHERHNFYKLEENKNLDLILKKSFSNLNTIIPFIKGYEKNDRKILNSTKYCRETNENNLNNGKKNIEKGFIYIYNCLGKIQHDCEKEIIENIEENIKIQDYIKNTISLRKEIYGVKVNEILDKYKEEYSEGFKNYNYWTLEKKMNLLKYYTILSKYAKKRSKKEKYEFPSFYSYKMILNDYSQVLEILKKIDFFTITEKDLSKINGKYDSNVSHNEPIDFKTHNFLILKIRNKYTNNEHYYLNHGEPIPKEVTKLMVDSEHNNCELFKCPSHIEFLNFYSFNCPVTKDMIGEKVHTLVVGGVSEPISKDIISPSVIMLIFSHNYRFQILPDNIPETVKILQLDKLKVPISKKCIPSHIKHLVLANGFCQDLGETVPDTIEKLEIWDIKEDFKENSLPKSVKHLILQFSEEYSHQINGLDFFTKYIQNDTKITFIDYGSKTIENTLTDKIKKLEIDFKKI